MMARMQSEVRSEATSLKAGWSDLLWDACLLAQQEPLGYYGGDTNLHRYVGNNPTDAVDPSGLYLQYLLDSSSVLGAGHAGLLIGPVPANVRNKLGDWKEKGKEYVYISVDSPHLKQLAGLDLFPNFMRKGGPFTFTNRYFTQKELDAAWKNDKDLKSYDWVLRFKTTPQQDATAFTYLISEFSDELGYRLFIRNCSHAALQALDRARIDFKKPVDPRPVSHCLALYDSASAIFQNQGGELKEVSGVKLRKDFEKVAKLAAEVEQKLVSIREGYVKWFSQMWMGGFGGLGAPRAIPDDAQLKKWHGTEWKEWKKNVYEEAWMRRWQLPPDLLPRGMKGGGP